MIAAIYARKSTEQTGVADEQKSVACQVDHARQVGANAAGGTRDHDAGGVAAIVRNASASDSGSRSFQSG
jgi:hypothetical protein